MSEDDARVYWNKNWLASGGRNWPNSRLLSLQNRVAELERERAQLLSELKRLTGVLENLQGGKDDGKERLQAE